MANNSLKQILRQKVVALGDIIVSNGMEILKEISENK